MFRVVWQVWLGQIGKKDIKNANKIKKTNRKNGICEMSIFFTKTFHDFAKIFDKIFNPKNKRTWKFSEFFDKYR